MTREIRFKYVYSDGKNYIFKIFDITQIENGEPFDAISDSPLLRKYKLIDRLQYTGLKDSAGNEIYEGDVCKINDLYCDRVVVKWVGVGFTGIAKEHYAISGHGEYPNNGYNLNLYTLKVIGSIHTHPELINK